jgi:transcription elongation factor Elf1
MTIDLKAERSEAYRDNHTQLVLSKFLSGEFEKLEPVFDLKRGYTYPTIEALVGDASQAEAFLDHLYDIGILKREVFDKTILCPKCNSGSVSIRYCCPYCKSFNVKKGSLIEHIQCGYIDVEDRFTQKGRLMCPRCHNELTKPEVNYRKAGVWCACNECGKNFDIPVPSHFCRGCKNIFMFEDSVYKNVYSYSLNPEAMKEAGMGYILVAPIRELFQKFGFSVESPGFLKGKSGASHMFDVAASQRVNTPHVIVIDLATSADNAVSEQSIIAMFAKVYDVAPDKACLIAIPRMSDNGRKLADLYKIELIEARNQKEALKALEAICLIFAKAQPESQMPQAQPSR